MKKIMLNLSLCLFFLCLLFQADTSRAWFVNTKKYDDIVRFQVGKIDYSLIMPWKNTNLIYPSLNLLQDDKLMYLIDDYSTIDSQVRFKINLKTTLDGVVKESSYPRDSEFGLQVELSEPMNWEIEDNGIRKEYATYLGILQGDITERIPILSKLSVSENIGNESIGANYEVTIIIQGLQKDKVTWETVGELPFQGELSP